MTKKLFFTAALAVVALLGIAGSAAAYSATVSPTTYTSSSAEVLFQSGSTVITCHVTLNGTLASTVSNVEEAGRHMGSVTSTNINSCNNGASVSTLNLNWEMTAAAVEGLPNEVGALNFSVLNASFNLSLFGGFVNCLYQGNAGAIMPVEGDGSGHYTATEIVTDETVQLPKHSGALCPGEGTMTATFRLGSTENITIA